MKSALSYLCFLLLFAGVLVAGHRNRAWEYLDQGQAYEQEGRLEDAVEQYEWAIQAYTPWGSALPEAIRRLESIGQSAESSGNHQLARTVWQSIVSGLSVVEHIWQPGQESLVRARENLAAVEQRMMEPLQGADPANR